MSNSKISSVAWVSVPARDKWSAAFKAINEAFIVAALAGVHEKRWQERSLKLYGNAWLLFLSKAKKYNVNYATRLSEEESSSSRKCYYATIYAADHTPAAAGTDLYTIWDIAHASETARLKAPSLIEHDQTLLSILLWDHIGLSLFGEQPLSLSSGRHVALVDDHLTWMEQTGLETAAALAREVLSWPVEWSSLNGIEEIRTPILKYMTTNWTKPYHTRHTVQLLGNAYPADGAAGLNFPYQNKQFKAVTDSASFKKGISHNATFKIWN